jgi:hypothetical protein
MATISGGRALEAKLAEIASKLARPATARIGFLEGSTYPSTPTKTLRAIYTKRRQAGISGAVAGAASAKSTAMIAAIQEFGAPRAGIPPRPFFRSTIAKHKAEWGPAIAGLLQANGFDAAKALDIAGAAIAGQLREGIIEMNAPPLSPVTVAKKGFSKPLVDTGHLLASIDHEVKW